MVQWKTARRAAAAFKPTRMSTNVIGRSTPELAWRSRADSRITTRTAMRIVVSQLSERRSESFIEVESRGSRVKGRER
jgi:hypothetical protein